MAEIVEIKHYPAGTLRHILSCYSREDLKIIASRLQIREPDKMKRMDLIECAASKILDETFAAEYWLNLYDDERAIYERVMAGEEIQIGIHEYDSCAYLAGGGYLFLLRSLTLEIPEEIRDLYNRVNTEAYHKERERYHVLRDYIRAAVSLYERIPAEKLAEIINSQNAEATTRGELVLTFQRMSRRTEAVEYRDYIFRDHYAAVRNKKHKDTALAAVEADSPDRKNAAEVYYIPAKETFLKYAQPGYVEEHPQYLKFRDFLIAELEMREMTAEMICDQLHLRITEGAGQEELLQELDVHGIWFKDRKQLLKAKELLAGLMLHTRKAENGGFTDWELEHMGDEGENSLSDTTDTSYADKEQAETSNIVSFEERKRER